MSKGPNALVSVLIPTYNSERWLGEAIASALTQTHEQLEIIVADNCSSDGTLSLARSFDDPRLTVHPSPVNRGAVENHNRLAKLSAGDYIKFLHADDTLRPSCIEEMVALAATDGDIGLVFAPRSIVTEGPDDGFLDEFGDTHLRFDELQAVNEGPDIVLQILDGKLLNWIGEPSAVLVTRRALESVGLFNPRLKQMVDLDLWLRIALHFRVGFIDHELSIYRHHGQSQTASHFASKSDWLDRLWLAESLTQASTGHRDRGRIRRFRNLTFLQTLKDQAIRIRQGKLDAQLARYLGYRAARAVGGSVKPIERLT